MLGPYVPGITLRLLSVILLLLPVAGDTQTQQGQVTGAVCIVSCQQSLSEQPAPYKDARLRLGCQASHAGVA